MNNTAEKYRFKGQRLRELRMEKGLTLDDLATQLVRHRATVSLWELDAHAPPSHVLPVLARILGVSPGYFFEE